MILSHKLENYKKSLQRKNMCKIITLIDILPDFLQKARNISLYKNFIVLCKNSKMHFFYFQFNEITKKIIFEKSLDTIKQYVII